MRKLSLLALPLLAIAALLLAAPASAAVAGTLIPLGPDGGKIQALVIDPLDPLTVYAGASPGGVFKSSDGGQAWTAMRNGFPVTTGASVISLAVDPSRHTT